jgi:serine phosphatase RsbU (regulator of sigma subunit)
VSETTVALAWRRWLFAVAGCVLLWIAQRTVGAQTMPGLWLHVIVGWAAWIAAVRFLLLDTRARRFWIVWLVAAAAAMFIAGTDPTGRTVAIGMTVAFLLLRRYHPYRHMRSGQRARAFLVGLVLIVMLSLRWSFLESNGVNASSSLGLAGNLARYASVSLRLFWLFSILRLFFGMRLHSLRLRPKLGVTALLIAAVPLVLVVIFAVVTVFGSLGGSRAARGHAVLAEWSQLATRDPDLASGHFDSSIDVVVQEGNPSTVEEHPDWLGDFSRILFSPPSRQESDTDSSVIRIGDQDGSVNLRWGGEAQVDAGSYWTPVDTTAYFLLRRELWLLNLQGLDTARVRVHGHQVNEAAASRLAHLLGCDISFHLGLSTIPDSTSETEARRPSVLRSNPGTEEEGDAASNQWSQPRLFGAGLLGVILLAPDGLREQQVIFQLQTSLAQLISEFIRGEFQLNIVLVAALGALALAFLIVEGFALFLGLRITRSVTSSVQALIDGTRRLATGDLDTRITVLTQDEFGDLATSFNEMTVAVKRGREEAIARERLERELQTAREIQERLLPHEIPAVPGFEMYGSSVPSRQVGGDYFDFLVQDDDRVGVAIADVSGKGIPAALLMSNLQASLQGQVIHPSTVAEIIARVNDLLVRSTDSQMFATFFYGVLDRNRDTFTCTNAGHNPPLLRRADGTVEWLERGGLLLGMLPGQRYEQDTVELAPGDVLVLYTDGITEAEGPQEDAEDDHMFGEERLVDVVHASSGQSAARISEAVLRAVTEHAAGVPQSDDITLVVIKRLSES